MQWLHTLTPLQVFYITFIFQFPICLEPFAPRSQAIYQVIDDRPLVPIFFRTGSWGLGKSLVCVTTLGLLGTFTTPRVKDWIYQKILAALIAKLNQDFETKTGHKSWLGNLRKSNPVYSQIEQRICPWTYCHRLGRKPLPPKDTLPSITFCRDCVKTWGCTSI